MGSQNVRHNWVSSNSCRGQRFYAWLPALDFRPRNKVLLVSFLHWLFLGVGSCLWFACHRFGSWSSLPWSPLFVVGLFTMSLSLAPLFTHLSMKKGNFQLGLPEHQDISVRASLACLPCVSSFSWCPGPEPTCLDLVIMVAVTASSRATHLSPLGPLHSGSNSRVLYRFCSDCSSLHSTLCLSISQDLKMISKYLLEVLWKAQYKFLQVRFSELSKITPWKLTTLTVLAALGEIPYYLLSALQY